MSNCFANPLKNIWRGTSGNCFILHWKEKNDISKNGCGKFTQPICAFVYVCACVPATALITLFYDFSTSLQICQQDSNKHSLGFWLWWTLHENYSPWSSLTSNKQTHRQRSSTAPRHNTFTNVSVIFFISAGSPETAGRYPSEFIPSQHLIISPHLPFSTPFHFSITSPFSPYSTHQTATLLQPIHLQSALVFWSQIHMLDCSLYRAWLPSGFSQLAQPSLFLMHLSSARQKSDLPKSVLVFVNKVWCGVTLCGKFCQCTAGNGPIHLLNPPQKIEEILHQREWCRIRSWCLPLCRSQTNGRYQRTSLC